MKYGLIGTSINESLSPFIHNFYGNNDYELKTICPDNFEDFMIKRDFLGINVTMPYKKKALEYLDRISPDAQRMESVNTIINENGALIGFNTDYFGFKELLDGKDICLSQKRVMILGCGGSAMMVRDFAIEEGALSVHMLKRDGSGFDPDAEIIVNTTPVGMFPNIFEHIDVSNCKNISAVIDIIYTPIRSELCIWAMSHGIKYVGGLYMLCSQASYSHEIFTGIKVPRLKVSDCFGECLNKTENIVLIGMPSCGKSKFGKILSKKMNRSYFDSDEEIEKKYKKSVCDIIEKDGEESFRLYEKDIIKELSTKKGAIISTGGGVILSKENMYNLRKNGRIYFIDKPLEQLEPTPSRPLSDDLLKLEILYNERYGLYLDNCDVQIAASGTDEQTVFAIGEEWSEHILYEESDFV